MTVEVATRIGQLNASNPASGDVKSEGDDHLRLIKTCLINSFPVDFHTLTFTTYQIQHGQSVRYNGTSLDVNVRARYSAYQTVSDMSIPTTTYSAIQFPVTAIENGFGFAWTTPGKLTVTTATKKLAFRVSGPVSITNPVANDYIRVRLMKNAGTVVSGPYSYYPGAQETGTVVVNLDIYQVIPDTLSNADVLYWEIGYIAGGTPPSAKSLYAGTRIDIYDMG